MKTACSFSAVTLGRYLPFVSVAMHRRRWPPRAAAPDAEPDHVRRRPGAVAVGVLADVVLAVGEEDPRVGLGRRGRSRSEFCVVVGAAVVGPHGAVDHVDELQGLVVIDRGVAQRLRREQLVGGVAELDGTHRLADVAGLGEQCTA